MTNMSAAFDLLKRDILMDKLISRGEISEGLALLIQDFLDGRKMIVNMGNEYSNEHQQTIGCVQGSTLGP